MWWVANKGRMSWGPELPTGSARVGTPRILLYSHAVSSPPPAAYTLHCHSPAWPCSPRCLCAGHSTSHRPVVCLPPTFLPTGRAHPTARGVPLKGEEPRVCRRQSWQHVEHLRIMTLPGLKYILLPQSRRARCCVMDDETLSRKPTAVYTSFWSVRAWAGVMCARAGTGGGWGRGQRAGWDRWRCSFSPVCEGAPPELPLGTPCSPQMTVP